MCGIVGVISANYGSNNRKFLADGGVVGQLRGYDSTGIAQQSITGQVSTFKLATIGTYFVGDKTVAKLLDGAGAATITFLHHRAATQGKVNAGNAHPFSIDRLDDSKTKVVGVHNGSLNNWKNKHNGKFYEVDSEWALSRITDEGDDAFKEIEGPYAFVWMDTAHKHKLFMCRNSGRPMHVVFSKDKKQMFFASEAGMLTWLCDRNNIDVENEILALTPGEIYEFDARGTTVTVTSRKAPGVVVPPAKTAASTTTTTAVKDVAPRNFHSTSDKTVPATSDGRTPGQMFVDGLKKACKSIEKQVDKAVAALTSDVAKIEEEIVSQRDSDAPVDAMDMFDGESVPMNWFSHDNVTVEEMAAAKKEGIFRELNWIEGVCWDEDTGDLMGDVQVFTPGNGKATLVGVLRGISRARAHAEYIDNGKAGLAGDWVVCVGLRNDPVCGKVVIVAELNQVGKNGIDKLHAA